jgi:hypothetical protein
MAAVLWAGTLSPAWSFSTTPAVQIIEAKPGETAKMVYTVTNDTDKKITLDFQLKEYFSLPENKSFKISDWLEPSTNKIIIPAHKSRLVPFKVKTPKNAVGELTGYISFIPEVKEEAKPKGHAGGIQTHIVTLITSAVYVRIKGTAIGEADLGDVRVQNITENPSQPAQVQASVVVKNTGNVHQRPSVHFDIENQKGDLVAAIDIASGWPVMAKSEMPYKATTKGALPAGNYVIKTKVSFTPAVFIEKKTSFTMDDSGQGTNYKDLK